MPWFKFLALKPKRLPWTSDEAKERLPMMDDSDMDERLVYTPARSRPLRRVIPWMPHVFLLIIYTAVFASWREFQPSLKHPGCACPAALEMPLKPWTARLDGTLLEIGDFFNITNAGMSPGAEAAWSSLNKHKFRNVPMEAGNLVRVNTAHVESPFSGDPRVLSKVHSLHCLHVLWRRWHNQTTEEEARLSITDEVHDDHCFAILRYALMCHDSIRIKQVGWPATDALHSGTMDVDQYCLDPVRNGVEASTRD